MAKTITVEMRLADAALKKLAKTPWRDLSLGDVARAAKIPLASLQSLGGKAALIGAILDKLGAETASRYEPQEDTAAKDRVLEVALTWFEINAARKPAIRALFEGLKFDPLTLLSQRVQFAAAAGWLLTLAEADTGPSTALRALGLAAIMARAIGVWLDDDADMSKTMARLDADLSRGENFLRSIPARPPSP